jgi:hypothetical protein
MNSAYWKSRSPLYLRPTQRARLQAGLKRAGVALAHHAADMIERGEDFDFNSAESHNLGLLRALGMDFSCELMPFTKG